MSFRGILHAGFLTGAVILLPGTLLQLGFQYLRAEENVVRHPNDNFDPSLRRLNNMEKLVAFTDSLATVKQITPDSMIAYAELADSVVRMRFYYGLQNYPFDDNFIANQAGKYIWSHLGAKVKPNDILKGQKAFCSQSSVVFQELLKSKGFVIRTVRLESHFCTEVLINGYWSFYDVSYKPFFKNLPRLSTQQLIDNPAYLQEAYLYSFREDFSRNFLKYFNPEKVRYGKVNSFGAPHMLLFHQLTWFLSWWGWMVFLLGALIIRNSGPEKELRLPQLPKP